MGSPAQERLREAMRGIVRQGVAYHGRTLEYAVIRGLAPIRAELIDHDEQLTEGDDLLLGHSVKQYDADYGLEVGDTLICHEMPDGNYAVTDVLHDNTVVAVTDRGFYSPDNKGDWYYSPDNPPPP